MTIRVEYSKNKFTEVYDTKEIDNRIAKSGGIVGPQGPRGLRGYRATGDSRYSRGTGDSRYSRPTW